MKRHPFHLRRSATPLLLVLILSALFCALVLILFHTLVAPQLPQARAASTGLALTVGCVVLLALQSAVGYLAYRFGSRKVDERLGVLRRALDEAMRGNLTVRMPVRGSDAMADLALSFNEMMVEIDRKIECEFRTPLVRQQAELKAFQSQLQPAFLLESIDTLRMLNRRGAADEVERAAVSLSGVLQQLTDSSQPSTLRTEFQLLERMFALHRLRTGEGFESALSLGGAGDVPMPRLALLAPVENALKHGLGPRRGRGRVEVNASWINGRACITVSDDGAGFSPARRAGNQKTSLDELRERILMCYRDAEVLLESEPGKGTTVTIRFSWKADEACTR